MSRKSDHSELTFIETSIREEISSYDLINRILDGPDLVNARFFTDLQNPHLGIFPDQLRMLVPTVDLDTLPKDISSSNSFCIFFNPDTFVNWVQFSFSSYSAVEDNSVAWLGLVSPFVESCVGAFDPGLTDPFNTFYGEHNFTLRLKLLDFYNY